MKTLHTIALIAVLAFTISSVHARDGQTFAVGARLHTDHSDFLELPFDEGDISYAAAYEYHEDNAYWQIAVTFTPDPSGTPATENVITPALNLIIEDGFWRGGIGALASLFEDATGKDEWSNVYYQLMLGIHAPLFGLQWDIMAYYVAETFSDLGGIDTDDLEYGAWVLFPF